MNFWERNGYYGQKRQNPDEKNKDGFDNRNNDSVKNGTLDGRNSGQVNIEEEMRRFSGMSNDELMTELMAKASISRANGTLNTAELERFYTVATMFMNTEQLTRLRALLNMLEK